MTARQYNSESNPSGGNSNDTGPSLSVVDRFIQTGVLNGPEPKQWLSESFAKLLLEPQNNPQAVSFYPMVEDGNMEIHGISNVYTTPSLQRLVPSSGRTEFFNATLQKTYTYSREIGQTGIHFVSRVVARVALQQYSDWLEDYAPLAELTFDVNNASEQQFMISSSVEHLRRGFRWHEPDQTEALVYGSYLSTLIVLALNTGQSVDNRDANL